MAATRSPEPHGPIRFELVPKPNGSPRPLVRLTPTDDQGYARAVARVAPFIERSRGPGTFANGIRRVSAGRIVLRPWGLDRTAWRRRVGILMRGAPIVAVTDVRDCYPSIVADVVRARLRACGAPHDAVADVMRWLWGFQDRGVRGLPVGPTPSAILAEAVLAAGDRALDTMGARYVRWVDDVVVFDDDPRTAVAALGALHRAWSSIRLEPNDEKTSLLERSIAMRRLRSGAPSGTGDVR